MDKEEHVKRHQELHKSLDELLGDFITHTGQRPSQSTIMELLRWSHQQTIDPEEVK